MLKKQKIHVLVEKEACFTEVKTLNIIHSQLFQVYVHTLRLTWSEGPGNGRWRGQEPTSSGEHTSVHHHPSEISSATLFVCFDFYRTHAAATTLFRGVWTSYLGTSADQGYRWWPSSTEILLTGIWWEDPAHHVTYQPCKQGAWSLPRQVHRRHLQWGSHSSRRSIFLSLTSTKAAKNNKQMHY